MNAQHPEALCGTPILSAKPIRWEPDGDRAWSGTMGFHVEFDPEEPPESRFTASWGEGDAENFATLEEAYAWCQTLADGWIREYGQVAEARTPRDDVEKAVIVLKVLHESSAAQCRKDGREELAAIHDEAVSLLDYTVELHRANMALPESDETTDLIRAEVGRAVVKFPTWPTDPLHAVAVLNEEVGELNKALLQAVYEPHKSTIDDVRSEAIQAAAMAYRFIDSLDRYEYGKCEQHEQPAAAAGRSPL